jgi:FKBP-type peptidyl-prolyl cis-trans isomerase FklB
MKIHPLPQAADDRKPMIFWGRARLAGVLVGAFALLLLAACDTVDEPAPGEYELEGDLAYGSYGLGHHLIGNVREQFGEDVDIEALILGVRDGFGDVEPRVSQDQFAAGIRALSDTADAGRAALASERLSEGREFLAENAQREGVVTLESGLQYEVITTGDGPRPERSDVVSTHYEGRLLSGETFDSSIARGQPARFPVDGVIEGWVEALQLMPVGSKWRLYVPPELAYGEAGAGNVIGPNETLIFDVELLEIVDLEAAREPEAQAPATE